MIQFLSHGISGAQNPELYAFGGDASEPVPLDVIAFEAFNERFYREE